MPRPSFLLSSLSRPRSPFISVCKSAPFSSVTVTSQVAGVVTGVEVTPNSRVKQGDPLVVLEAMKMNHIVRSPKDGFVSSINLVPSQLVASGQSICVVDEEPAVGTLLPFLQKKAISAAVSGLSSEVKSNVSGVVTRVVVQPGQSVNVGDEVVILDSMKMHHSIRSNVAGVVTEIKVGEGSVIESGDVVCLVGVEGLVPVDNIDPITQINMVLESMQKEFNNLAIAIGNLKLAGQLNRLPPSTSPMVASAKLASARFASSSSPIPPQSKKPFDQAAVLAEIATLPRPKHVIGERFNKILIANRGEIARRIIRTCKKLGIKTVAVYSDADAKSPHVREADESVHIGPSPASQSYLHGELMVLAALKTGAQAIHPGYGFLSENPNFATLCKQSGLLFIGPTAQNIEDFGLKHTSRKIAAETGIPVIPGTDALEGPDQAVEEAKKIGYPVLIKLTAGGGGVGMYVCNNEAEIRSNWDRAAGQGKNSFKDNRILMEKYIESARHIEVQCFGDGNGRVVHLGERECTVQRRHQKVIEESPSPSLSNKTRRDMCHAAVSLLSAVKYLNAGTVEFVLDDKTQQFYFLEVNTRLQVEHGITELVTGVDLVEWMVDVGAGLKPPSFEQWKLDSPPLGHAIEARILAEHPYTMMPNTGKIGKFKQIVAPWLRFDGICEAGNAITPHYDSLIGKLMVHGKDRKEALERLEKALNTTDIPGLVTNTELCLQIIKNRQFNAYTNVTTKFLETMPRRSSLQVISTSMEVGIQDFPGRLKHWAVGVPPSGPMDSLTPRLINALVGNDESGYGTRSAPCLELLLGGAEFVFHSGGALADATNHRMVALGGPPGTTGRIIRTKSKLSSSNPAKNPTPMETIELKPWTSVQLQDGDVVVVDSLPSTSPGLRVYLAISGGGFDVPEFLGSSSTFVHGGFGGFKGRGLGEGDFVGLKSGTSQLPLVARSLPANLIPEFGREWEVSVLPGPHAEPDFFTAADVKKFYESTWEVHHHSNRLGMRLTNADENEQKNPNPWQFARPNGGDGGNHPSNVVDCVYGIGAINFTGNMPIILTQDGPSLGGFVCMATVLSSELWKIGQAKARDKIRFRRVSLEEAERLRIKQLEDISAVNGGPKKLKKAAPLSSGLSNLVLKDNALCHLRTSPIRAEYRLQGNDRILLEYGEQKLDLRYRARVHFLMKHLNDLSVEGILELSPGVRSLQIHYDPSVIGLNRLIEVLDESETKLPSENSMKIQCRVLNLPLSFDDETTRETIRQYSSSIRPKAPYLPSNIDFIARCNGLKNGETVKKLVFDATYCVMGLGDVYLSAPCAVALDPRHQFLVPKYNPARTTTPEGTVGFGGSYLCIYGMDSPGGYQLVGRTLSIWNTHQTGSRFTKKPWMMQSFDMIKFFPVSGKELGEIREKWSRNEYDIDMGEQTLDIGEYARFLDSISEEIVAKRKIMAASAEEACKGY